MFMSENCNVIRTCKIFVKCDTVYFCPSSPEFLFEVCSLYICLHMKCQPKIII